MAWSAGLGGKAVMPAVCLLVAGASAGLPNRGAAAPAPPVLPALAYADLVDLADSAPLVLRALVRKQAVVEPARAGTTRDGEVRLYIEATPLASLGAGSDRPLPPLLRYLADVPLDARGKVPSLKKQTVLLFARPAPASGDAAAGDELQLVAPDAQLVDSAELETRVLRITAQLAAADAPGPISAVREAIFVPGPLAGSGETQIFLATNSGAPASISVERTPGAPPRWSASFSEVVDASGKPPQPETLAWYRLACFLPATLPPGANVSETPDNKQQAARDYAFVRGALGACGRLRR